MPPYGWPLPGRAHGNPISTHWIKRAIQKGVGTRRRVSPVDHPDITAFVLAP